jgi:peptidoglycan/xylan/chitin deacetylase (PgdA/CDA1 family)
MLTDRLGHEPVSLSYPVGSVDDRVKRIAREVGYKLGFAVNQVEYNSDEEDIFEISRIELYDEGMFKTKLRAHGIIQKMKHLF